MVEKIDKLLILKSKKEQSEKPSAAKPLPSRWIPDEDQKPRVNVSYQKVPRQFIERRRSKKNLIIDLLTET